MLPLVVGVQEELSSKLGLRIGEVLVQTGAVDVLDVVLGRWSVGSSIHIQDELITLS